MSYQLELKPDSREIKISNLSSNHLDVFFMDLQRNKGIYRCKLTKHMWGNAYIPADARDCYIYINDDNMSVSIYKVDETFNLIKSDRCQDFNFDNPFVFIGGHTGGGTSVVAKALRLLGIHFGDDCGDFENRKAHESTSMRVWTYSLDEMVHLSTHKEKLLDVISTYNYQQGKINCFKVPGDTSNGAGQKIYKIAEVLPNTKFISVIRKRNGFHSTQEGSNFSKGSDYDVLVEQFYKLEGSPIFHLDFLKFFTDYTYFNKLLTYIGHSSLLQNADELESIKVKIDFNDQVLK